MSDSSNEYTIRAGHGLKTSEKSELEMEHSISDTRESLTIYGIHFLAVRQSQDFGPSTAYSAWIFSVNGFLVNFWKFNTDDGKIEIIDMDYSDFGIAKRYGLDYLNKLRK